MPGPLAAFLRPVKDVGTFAGGHRPAADSSRTVANRIIATDRLETDRRSPLSHLCRRLPCCSARSLGMPTAKRTVKPSEHPVWSVYDRLRTARLNRKYYSRRLVSLEQRLFNFDLILAIAAPSSAVAGLWLWDTSIGAWAWRVLGVVAALAAVIKPLLLLPRRIKDTETVLSGYRTLEHDLFEIKTMVEQRRAYDAALVDDFKKALQREKVLVGNPPEQTEHRPTKALCEIEVDRELPPDSFFVPEI